jgi:hypothetical protein
MEPRKVYSLFSFLSIILFISFLIGTSVEWWIIFVALIFALNAAIFQRMAADERWKIVVDSYIKRLEALSDRYIFLQKKQNAS